MQFSFKRAVEKIVDDAVDQTGSISMRAQQLFEKLFHAFQRKENQFFFLVHLKSIKDRLEYFMRSLCQILEIKHLQHA